MINQSFNDNMKRATVFMRSVITEHCIVISIWQCNTSARIPPCLVARAEKGPSATVVLGAPADRAGGITGLTFAAAHLPELTAPDDAALTAALARACEGMSSFAELRKANLLQLLDADLAPLRAQLDRIAPTHAELPRRRRVAIHYELDRAPWIASRLQDFFGAPRGPAVANGRVPLVLHLLAPNQRPVQVTQDLPGFWQRHYPELRRQLMRRYPKHGWPEDPMQFISGD